jgi:superfamily II DNA/RNA helicase
MPSSTERAQKSQIDQIVAASIVLARYIGQNAPRNFSQAANFDIDVETILKDLQSRRDEIAQQYFDLLKFDPYPVQEEALFAWFENEQGVLVCAPTGTGKTLIAEAALYEALQLGKQAYYTTPLIALTDQKFRELQEKAVEWGFSADDVGLVTGNRKVNPQAKILVVVAEILLNRLLHTEAFDFRDTWAVVMDEFHSFNDPERGIVWEFSLGLLPPEVKTLLLSATVGNSMEFVQWLTRVHNRRLKLVEGTERKVPLTYHWVEDEMLPEQIEKMVQGTEESRYTPALLFCFNREQCWTMAEMLKGKKCVDSAQQKLLSARLDEHDWSQGVGPKLKQILIRGIGVHHAGVLPRYRQIVEELFIEKLLSVCVCTETLAAGLNLPARSVVLPTLIKGPRGKMKTIPVASAHQMFGRAGRPQFDDQGHVFALPHEDDVKILRWKEKYDQIPEDTKDPGLRKAKKSLKKKQPKRREGQQYWSQQQFDQLVAAPSADLASRGPLPWRLLVYMLDASSKVERIRKLIAGRLLKPKDQESAQKILNRQLITLWRGGYITLDPKPPIELVGPEPKEAASELPSPGSDGASPSLAPDQGREGKAPSAPSISAPPESTDAAPTLTFGGGMLDLGQKKQNKLPPEKTAAGSSKKNAKPDLEEDEKLQYKPITATPTEAMDDLLLLRGVHPLYAVFLMKHLGIADRNERVMAFESILELSRSLGKAIRIPQPEYLPPGPLATTRLDSQLLKLGLATAEELYGKDEDEEENSSYFDDDWIPILTLPYKLQRLFQHDFPDVHDVKVTPVWVAGEALQYGTDFNKYITSNKLQKQEGIVFRHLLRLVLLLDEMAELCPPDVEHDVWRDDLADIANQLEDMCRSVDPQSTDQWLAETRPEKTND